MIEFLEKDLPIPNIGLAFIYCNHKEKLSQNVESFLGTIARQLIEQRQTISEDVHALHESHRGKGTTPTRVEYLTLLQSLATKCSEVYIVIDALDECIDNKGESIWDDLLSQLMGSILNLRLLCTSRDIDDTGGILSSSTCIEIQASDADIEVYVQAQIKSKRRLRLFCDKNPAFQNEIPQVIKLKAHGM